MPTLMEEFSQPLSPPRSSDESKAERNKSGVILHINYTTENCTLGHVWVEAFDRRTSTIPESVFNFGICVYTQARKTSASIPLFIPNKDLSDLETAYSNSFLKNCCNSTNPCYCLCTNNCADSSNHVLTAAGFNIQSMPSYSWQTCITSECCPTSESCCCCVPICGCSTPQQTIQFAFDLSKKQMASDDKTYSLLHHEYKKLMTQNGCSADKITQVMQDIDADVKRYRALRNNPSTFFPYSTISFTPQITPDAPTMTQKK